MARIWTYEEKIRLRVGMRFGLLDTEALALEGDTIEELEKAAFQLRAERKDDLESALQRKVAKQDLDEQTPPYPLPPVRVGLARRGQTRSPGGSPGPQGQRVGVRREPSRDTRGDYLYTPYLHKSRWASRKES